MSLSQKEAVYQAVEAYLEDNGRAVPEAEAVQLSTDERKTVVAMLIAFTDAGEVAIKPSSKAAQNLPKYWNGALSNFLRKDTRLNGGVKYATKNPGSRIGKGDAMLKNLKLLRNEVVADSDRASIDAAITARQQELRALAQPAAEINRDLIPDALQHLVNS